MPGGDAGAPGQPGGGAVVIEQIGQGERQVLPVAVQLPSGEVEHLLLGAHHARVGAQVAQGRHPALADDALGVLADHAQHADHGAGVVAQRAVGEGVVGLLRVAGPLQEQQQRLVPGRLPRGQHGVDARADVVPDLRPHLAGRPAQRPRVLAAQGVAPVGGVAEERQLRAPGHPHREAGRQQDAHRRLQALRPGPGRPERGGRPVHRGQVPADLVIGGEHPGRPRPGLGACRTRHWLSSPPPPASRLPRPPRAGAGEAYSYHNPPAQAQVRRAGPAPVRRRWPPALARGAGITRRGWPRLGPVSRIVLVTSGRRRETREDRDGSRHVHCLCRGL